MLVEFGFASFRSFRDAARLNLVAASDVAGADVVGLANGFVARGHPLLELLRVVTLYGANASGKSNVVLAIKAFQNWVTASANVGFGFDQAPFFNDTYSSQLPTTFEAVFVLHGVLLRYGFEVRGVGREILGEWLFRADAGAEVESVLFEREGSHVRRSRGFRDGSALLKAGVIKRADALFLSLMAQIGEPTANTLVTHVERKLRVISGLEDEALRDYSIRALREGRHAAKINSLMREADTGISEITVMDSEQHSKLAKLLEGLSARVEPLTDHVRALIRGLEANAVHRRYDERGQDAGTGALPVDLFESQGTQKLLAISARLMEALEDGSLLVIDEMDARFHPLLTQAIIRLFQSQESNPKNGQLVFVTHDTNLLDPKRFRRDQIWFVEKDRFGASHLYSLADFKGVSKDASFEEEYIQGRYGAIPFLGGIRQLFADGVADDDTVSQTRRGPETLNEVVDAPA